MPRRRKAGLEVGSWKGIESLRQFLVPIDSLTPDPGNAREHGEQNIQAIKDSFLRFGQQLPILYDSERVVRAGNGRLQAARELGWTVIAAVPSDLAGLDAAAFAITDNRTAELAGWDWTTLGAGLAELSARGDDLLWYGFDAAQVAEVEREAGAGIEPKDAEPQIDRAAELQKKWKTKTGQLWLIGKHRLLIGDSTNTADVSQLLDGNRPLLMVTDPPYGVKRDKGFGGAAAFGGSGAPIARRKYKGDWDSERPTKETFDLILESSKAAIIFGGNFFADLLPQSSHWIVWDKLNTMPTFGDCELAWTNVNRTSVKKYTVEYNGLIGKEKERLHATQKPVALLVAILSDYSKSADGVSDFFVGGGTTLVACENLKRKCFAMEISPAYCAVILERMSTAFPGIKIERG